MFKRLRHHILPAKDHDIKNIEHDWPRRGTVVLQGVERRTTALVERDDFAIDYCVVGKAGKALDNRRIAQAEIVVIARAEVQFAVRLEGDSSIAIELQL